MRTSSRQIQDAAEAALIAAFREVGLRAEAGDHSADLVVADQGGDVRVVEVKGRAVASTLSPTWLESAPGTTLVVVGDVVTSTAREQLRAQGAGWLDRRGHLHLPDIYDGPVTAMQRQTAAGVGGPLAGRGALEVAVAALLGAGDGVRALARSVGLAASTISAAGSALRQELLLTSDGQAVLPDLFEELVRAWQPDWSPLAGDPGGGLHQVDMVIGGDVAAAMRGAPVVVSTATPARYYVQDEHDAQAVVDVLGAAQPVDAAAWVAVSPSRYALASAEPVSESVVPWMAGRVLPARLCAVELAGDRGRGREVLADWRLPEAPWSP